MEYTGSKEFIKCDNRGEIYTDSSADYSLPDYNGDVRRILFAHAKVHRSGSFENKDSVDFSGIVAYDIVYADSENKINSVSFNSDYDFTVKCDTDEFVSVNADISVADFSLRLLGPRKFSARATVVANAVISCEKSLAPTGDVFDGADGVEVDVSQIQVCCFGHTAEQEREYAEEICRFDGAVLDEVNVILSDAECTIDSVTAEENGACVKGNVRVYALVQSTDGTIFTAEKSIRIDEHVDFSERYEGMRLLPSVRVDSIRHNVNTDENGCAVIANIILSIGVGFVGNQSVEVVTDAYSKTCEVENSYEDFRFREIVCVAVEKEDLTSAIDRESVEIENLRELLVLRADAVIEDCKMEEGMISVLGEIRYSGVASGTDSNGCIVYYPLKISTKFAKNAKFDCQNCDNLSPEIKIICRDAGAVFDEKEISLSCVADFEILVMRENSQCVLSASKAVEDSNYKNDGTKITVYYPEHGERLFDIAKKFHTTVEKISADNQTAIRAMSGGDCVAPARLLIY